MGEWVDGGTDDQEQIAQAGGGGGQAIQVAVGLGPTPTRLPGQFGSPFPPASFPVALLPDCLCLQLHHPDYLGQLRLQPDLGHPGLHPDHLGLHHSDYLGHTLVHPDCLD